MAERKPPFKLALAALFLDGRTRRAGEAEAELAVEYAGQRFFEPAFVKACLQSLTAVGILEKRIAAPDVQAAAGQDSGQPAGNAAGRGILEPHYILTPYGREKVLRSL